MQPIQIEQENDAHFTTSQEQPSQVVAGSAVNVLNVYADLQAQVDLREGEFIFNNVVRPQESRGFNAAGVPQSSPNASVSCKSQKAGRRFQRQQIRINDGLNKLEVDDDLNSEALQNHVRQLEEKLANLKVDAWVYIMSVGKDLLQGN